MSASSGVARLLAAADAADRTAVGVMKPRQWAAVLDWLIIAAILLVALSLTALLGIGPVRIPRP